MGVDLIPPDVARAELDAMLCCLYGEAAVSASRTDRRQPLLRALAAHLGFSSERVCAVYYGRRTIRQTTMQKWRVTCGYPG
jgi:hypothetical protein